MCFGRRGTRGRSASRRAEWRSGRQFVFRHARGFLESLAKLEEAVRVHRIVAFAVNLFELGGQLGGAAFISSAEVHVEQALERRGMTRRALQNIFEQMRGLLR